MKHFISILFAFLLLVGCCGEKQEKSMSITANQHPSSVCSVGVVMVRDGQMVDSFYSLIQPEPNDDLTMLCLRVS